MADNRNNPPKPNKDQTVRDLPQKGNTSKDAIVKGGTLGTKPKPFQEVNE